MSKKKDWVWFALSPDRPVFFFAGIWGKWTGARGTKANPATGEHELFGFLTTDPNGDVSQVHPKAMPVILTAPDQLEAWMTRPISEAIELQRPLPNGLLSIVARGSEKQDPFAPSG